MVGVDVSSFSRSLSDYEPIIGSDEVRSIMSLAERVRGAKVIHVNATAYGGGVAEMLKSLVPLSRSVGLNVKWEVVTADPDFFRTTKRIHNALQGNMEVRLTEEEIRHYLEVARKNASELDLESDVVVIHDPQPLPIIKYVTNRSSPWVWRCHIDLSNPNPSVWAALKPYVMMYDALIFTMEAYVPRDVRGPKIYIRRPSIDPLSPKNKPLSPSEVLKVLSRYGVDPDRPILGQVSRFDPWKDPLGVIDTFKLVKEKVSDAQLVMIGAFAHDDPEGTEWYRKTVKYAEGLKDVHILTNHDGVGDHEVNAFQRASTVVIQLSTREGFCLAVTEALWKGTPVVATRAGGIPLQVIDGVTGYLVGRRDYATAARRVVELMRRPWLARALGNNGREHVRRNFLITRLLRDYLRMQIDLVSNVATRSELQRATAPAGSK